LPGFQLRLAGFEGPLDVLLRLIEEHRLEITTLSLVEVTDGFVTYVSGLVDPPPALLAEFISVAARLLVLKSRALIPQPPSESGDEDVVDMAQQLEQYRRMRAIGESLRARESRSVRSYGRSAAPLRRFVNTTLALPSLTDLQAVYARAATRVAILDLPRPAEAQISIQEMIERLQVRLRLRAAPLRFREAVGRERATLVAGFVALLALWAQRHVDLSQDGLFGEIWVHYTNCAAPPAHHSRTQA
jgi:segregation and condensation protein A